MAKRSANFKGHAAMAAQCNKKKDTKRVKRKSSDITTPTVEQITLLHMPVCACTYTQLITAHLIFSFISCSGQNSDQGHYSI